MKAAKDQLAAAGICPDGPADLPGAIGRAVLATLLPARRLRFSARKAGCATSRYLNRDDGRPAHPAAITATGVAISTPPLDLKPGRTHRDRTIPGPPRLPRSATCRQQITAIIASQPPREWSGHDLALLLGARPRNMLTQLGEWARLGFFTRTGSLDRPARSLTSRLCYAIGFAEPRPAVTRQDSAPMRMSGQSRTTVLLSEYRS